MLIAMRAVLSASAARMRQRSARFACDAVLHMDMGR